MLGFAFPDNDGCKGEPKGACQTNEAGFSLLTREFLRSSSEIEIVRRLEFMQLDREEQEDRGRIKRKFDERLKLQIKLVQQQREDALDGKKLESTNRSNVAMTWVLRSNVL